jgi:hypothetical protein
VGSVSIWWGHKEGDADWACKHWVDGCGDGHCYSKGPYADAHKC